MLEIPKEYDVGTYALELIQKRHAFDVKETQKNVELDHQKFADGIANTDFNQ